MTPEHLTAWREALGGTRFFLTLGAGVVNTVLLILGVIDQDTYSDLTNWTVSAYIIGATATQFRPKGS